MGSWAVADIFGKISNNKIRITNVLPTNIRWNLPKQSVFKWLPIQCKCDVADIKSFV